MSDGSTRRLFLRRSAVILGVGQIIPVKRITGAVPSAAPRFPIPLRQTLAAVADTLIPAHGRMPAASAIGTVSYLEAAAHADPTFGKALQAALRSLPDIHQLSGTHRTARLRMMEKEESTREAFAVLRDAVYEAYYTNPKVWSLLGYRFRAGRRRTAPIEQFDERVTERVRQMPRLYREA